MGLNLFRDKIIQSDPFPIREHLIHIILIQIESERQGCVIDRNAIQPIIAMLLELKDVETNNTMYAVEFEVVFLKKSALFYQIESQRLLSNCDALEFMQKVNGLFFFLFIYKWNR